MIEYRVCNVCLQADVLENGKVQAVSFHTVQCRVGFEPLRFGYSKLRSDVSIKYTRFRRCTKNVKYLNLYIGKIIFFCIVG